ncbi:MAG: hypothetical protein QOK11_2132, partial [Pseudonocardiales bacterium]|nr:hypothetical protein [Pseudonocardiales bacterium]
MGDEEELRARIAAQIAARRAESAPSGRDESDGSAPGGAEEFEFDAATAESAQGDLDAEAEPGGGGADEPQDRRVMEPIRPWLLARERPATGSAPGAPAPPEADGETRGSRNLEPIRPWLLQPGFATSGDGAEAAPEQGAESAAGEPVDGPVAVEGAGTAAALRPARPWLGRPRSAAGEQAAAEY